ncbi:unnamed protein product [Chrysodeixis includens]|uniref:Uncharacterized protein n=1 Tax=Chrysodeixis includens TaxID=689277 RepID=A0A9P0FQP6_CHRIL|nr:unnamed protein product [Chrysodeixis includens]
MGLPTKGDIPKVPAKIPNSLRQLRRELQTFEVFQDGGRAVKWSTKNAITPQPYVVERCGFHWGSSLGFPYNPGRFSGLKIFWC